MGGTALDLMWFAGAAINAAANVTGNATSAIDPTSWFDRGSLPEWLTLLAGTGIGAGLIAVLISFRERFPEKEKHPDKEFTRMLCAQIWTHTDSITGVFAQRMRLHPVAIEQLRVLVRNLREDLAGPVNFIDQMRCHDPKSWPSYELFRAFTAWSGQVRSIESQLADLLQMITFPVVKDPIDKSRDAGLVHHYLTEQAILQRAIDRVHGRALELCAAARKHLGKDKKPGKADEDEDGHDHPTCPCCRKNDGAHSVTRVEAPIELPPAPPPPPPPPPKPAPVCRCAAPQMCRCACCTCCCTCPPPASKSG